MSETKSALIIANYRYEHSDLRQLLAPAQDAESLARVLSDPGIGGFEVSTVINEPSHKVSLEIEGFCDNRKRDDLLLLYFSGHGIKDADGQLYFATIDTQLVQQNVRRATAVSANFVNEVMSRSRSRRQILLLDCCYSGAFKEGMLAKGSKRVGAGEQLEGQGRIVLTASDALQYSFEGGHVQGEGIRSVFTRFLVRGLETGEADLDHDGSFSLDEVYEYVYGRVADEQPEQRPTKMGYVEGKIFIGNNPRPVAAELSPELQQSIDDSRPWVRLAAVQELEKLLDASSKGLVLAAQAALSSLATGDDSQQVRTRAAKCLVAHADIQSSEPKKPATDHKKPPLAAQPELPTGEGLLSSVSKRDEGKEGLADATPSVPPASVPSPSPAGLRKEEPRPLEVSELAPTSIAAVSQPESVRKAVKKQAPKWARPAFAYGGLFALVVGGVVAYFSLRHVPSHTETKPTQHAAVEMQSNSSTSSPEHTSESPVTAQSESETNRSPVSASTRKHTSAPPVVTQQESESNQPTSAPPVVTQSESETKQPSWLNESDQGTKSTGLLAERAWSDLPPLGQRRGKAWTDSETGLMWATEDKKEGLGWKEANSYCTSLRVRGYSDWRLPTIEELDGLCTIDTTDTTDLFSSKIDKGNCEFKKGIDQSKMPDRTWSSTKVISKLLFDLPKFKAIDFSAPSFLNEYDASSNTHLSALCVRGSKSQSNPFHP